MSTHDDNVSREEVLDLVERLRTESALKAMARVSEVEPVVVAYAAAAATKLEEYARESGIGERVCRTIFREALLAQVVCVEAVRLGHYKLWQDAMTGGDAGKEVGRGQAEGA